MGPRFYLRILPLAGLGVLATAAGSRLGLLAPGPGSIAVALAIGAACFVAAHTFRTPPGWVAVFIVGLSLAAGVLLARIGSGLTLATILMAAVPLVLAAIVGRALRTWLAGLYTPLWLGAWMLVLGAIAIWLVRGAGAWTAPLALAAGLVFTAFGAAWFARVPPDPPPVAGMDLYLLGLNLFLATNVLQHAVG